MLDLIQITADPAFAARCDALPGVRLFVDLEQHGKAERQAGRNTFISTHTLADVGRVRQAALRARLMVRVNPLHAGSAAEVDAVLAQGLRTAAPSTAQATTQAAPANTPCANPQPDCLMLPMFTRADELAAFCRLVAGRVPVVALVETLQAVRCLPEWIATPGLGEVFVGLNDLHLSMGCAFMFEPLADAYSAQADPAVNTAHPPPSTVEYVARAAHAHGLPFGFGGIARLDEGLLPGRDVLAEHERLGSSAVILSRTFHRSDAPAPFEADVAALRALEAQWAQRSDAQRVADQRRIAATIHRIAAEIGARTSAPPPATPPIQPPC